jgi:hypothetical protein
MCSSFKEGLVLPVCATGKNVNCERYCPSDQREHQRIALFINAPIERLVANLTHPERGTDKKWNCDQ